MHYVIFIYFFKYSKILTIFGIISIKIEFKHFYDIKSEIENTFKLKKTLTHCFEMIKKLLRMHYINKRINHRVHLEFKIIENPSS